MVRVEIYAQGKFRMELIYENDNLTKIVPYDANGNAIEDQIVFPPVISVPIYR